MNRYRIAVAALLTFAGIAVAAGCSGRLTTQEAYETCTNLEKTLGGDAKSFEACVACFENCADCEPAGTTPPSFHCPDDGTASSSSSGSTSSGGG